MLTEQVLALLSLAAAVAVSGTRPARLRLSPAGDPTRRNRFVRRPPLPVVFGLSTGALVATLAGMPAGVAVAVAGGYAVHRIQRRGWRPGGPADQLDLAAGWDLLAACLRAGLPVPTAIRAVADDLPRAAAGALRATADLLALGADPVEAWTPALDCPATAALARAARRTARSGTALAGVAGSLATDIRAAAGDVAESRAQRAGVLITGPLGLCFLPAFVCLGIAPVVVGLATQLSVQQ
ncbi:MAG TPA: type II secretion system F family protein [Actinophytocola sp.]|uniref:type II secretion system F family protein n=1 Tax=Actinophytocola sp. TaxID=1872138 RepID=UPI002DBF60D9|nr:type II secretion system F family protein [Actinophytocola sp.]HEU5474317.1 type II secretion system F family protein [Actinophytocola sp.]